MCGTTLARLLKLQHVNAGTIPHTQTFSCLGFGQVVFIKAKKKKKSLRTKYSSSSLLPTPLISVVCFSWPEDRKTYRADTAALPPSPQELTSSGREMACCGPTSACFLQTRRLCSRVCAADGPLLYVVRFRGLQSSVSRFWLYLPCLKVVRHRSRGC